MFSHYLEMLGIINMEQNQIKKLADATEASDAMTYGQYNRTTVSTWDELKTAINTAGPNQTAKSIYLAEPIPVPADETVSPNAECWIFGAAVSFLGDFTVSGNGSLYWYQSSITMNSDTTVTLGLSNQFLCRRLTAENLTVTGGGTLLVEDDSGLTGTLTGNITQSFWDNTGESYFVTDTIEDTGEFTVNSNCTLVKERIAYNRSTVTLYLVVTVNTATSTLGTLGSTYLPPISVTETVDNLTGTSATLLLSSSTGAINRAGGGNIGTGTYYLTMTYCRG